LVVTWISNLHLAAVLEDTMRAHDAAAFLDPAANA